MFSGITYDVPASTGKKIYGLPTRKDPAFNIGWDNQSHLNSYQMKQHKNKEVTSKITSHTIIQGQQDLRPQRTPYELQQKDYQRIFYENPNITQEELEKVMAQYEQYRGSVPSRSSKQEAPLENERRAPIRPRQNMKDIIYNGVGVGEEGRVGSRRNNSNFKADSYNYHPSRN